MSAALKLDYLDDSLASFERHCYRNLERYGVERKPTESFTDFSCIVTSQNYPEEKDRWCAWMSESALYAIREIRHPKCDPAVVLRCTLQMVDYVGRCRGYWPTAGLQDTYSFLKNWCEDRVRGNRP